MHVEQLAYLLPFSDLKFNKYYNIQ